MCKHYHDDDDDDDLNVHTYESETINSYGSRLSPDAVQKRECVKQRQYCSGSRRSINFISSEAIDLIQPNKLCRRLLVPPLIVKEWQS